MIGRMFRPAHHRAARSHPAMRALAVGLCLLCATACARGGSTTASKEDAMQSNQSPRAGRTVDGYTYTDAPVEARLGPHVFRFPANYYRDQMGPNFDGSFSLLVQWPDLQPLPPGERSGQDMATFDRQITIAPHYVDRVPIETLLDRMTMPMAEPGSIEADDPRDRLDLMVVQPEHDGLTPYVVDQAKLASYARRYKDTMGVPTGTRAGSYKDWFVRRDARGQLLTVITCDPQPEPGADTRPQCTHDFTIPEQLISVSVDYDRSFLIGWEKIESRARALLAEYRID